MKNPFFIVVWTILLLALGHSQASAAGTLDVYPVYTIVGSKHVEGAVALQQYADIAYVDFIVVQGEVACLYPDESGSLSKVVIGGIKGMECVRVLGTDILTFKAYILSPVAAITTIYYKKPIVRSSM